MRRIFLSILAASTIFLTTTFAGMAVFGMGTSAPEAGHHEACVGEACHAEPLQASGTECVDHCVAAIPPASVTTASSLAVTFVFFALAALAGVGLFTVDRLLAPGIRRWREGIGKVLLRQSLATVMLRN